MEIESKVSVKKDNGDVISADVLLYNETGDIIKKITIIDSEELRELEETIDQYKYEYVSQEQLINKLNNLNNDITINASKLGGYNANEVALKTDIPLTLEPTKHDSTTQTYGLGSTSKYGHVKTRDNLTATTYINGESLSAYQGALLNNRLIGAEKNIETLQNNTSKGALHITLGRLRNGAYEGEYGTRLLTLKGDTVYAHVTCDNPNYKLDGKEVIIRFEDGYEYTYKIDKDGYTTNSDGKRGGKTIEWTDKRNNLIYAFISGDQSTGLRPAHTVKRLQHNTGE